MIAYYLPEWVPRSTYVEIAQRLHLKDIRFDDWTEYVEPFWPAVIKSALVPKNFISMLKSGLSTIKGAIAAVSLINVLIFKSLLFIFFFF